MAGQPPTAQHAVHFEAGSDVVIDIRCRFTDEPLVRLNANSTRYLDRVAVYPEAFRDPRELTAVLRHELEHAVQFRLQPDAYRRAISSNRCCPRRASTLVLAATHSSTPCRSRLMRTLWERGLRAMSTGKYQRSLRGAITERHCDPRDRPIRRVLAREQSRGLRCTSTPFSVFAKKTEPARPRVRERYCLRGLPGLRLWLLLTLSGRHRRGYPSGAERGRNRHGARSRRRVVGGDLCAFATGNGGVFSC
jgi:hypothetical protein